MSDLSPDLQRSRINALASIMEENQDGNDMEDTRILHLEARSKHVVISSPNPVARNKGRVNHSKDSDHNSIKSNTIREHYHRVKRSTKARELMPRGTTSN